MLYLQWIDWWIRHTHTPVYYWWTSTKKNNQQPEKIWGICWEGQKETLSYMGNRHTCACKRTFSVCSPTLYHSFLLFQDFSSLIASYIVPPCFHGRCTCWRFPWTSVLLWVQINQNVKKKKKTTHQRQRFTNTRQNSFLISPHLNLLETSSNAVTAEALCLLWDSSSQNPTTWYSSEIPILAQNPFCKFM